MALSENSHPDSIFAQDMDIAMLLVEDREACTSLLEKELAPY